MEAPRTRKYTSAAVTESPAVSAGQPTRIRYRVLGLTFLMAFLMYMERSAIGAATPSIRREFGIDKITMGWCLSAFNWSYALFQIPGGWMADRLGSRLVLTLAIAWWSAFTAATAFSFNAISLAVTRFLFGAGEAAAFPAGSRALVRWLPVRSRAFGQGFQHAGARLGAAIAPAIVAWLLVTSGWRIVFYVFGGAGVIWAAVWYAYYRNEPASHPGVNEAEVELLADAQPDPAKASRRIPWSAILRSRDVWRLSFAYFCYAWVLWLYLSWFPTYLQEARHFTAIQSGWASLPLFAATITNVLGGISSDKLTSRIGDLRRGRVMISVFGFVVAALGLLPGVLSGSPVAAMACLTIALGGLEMTVAVSWAICLDLGGPYSGSVASVMNTFGQIGGAFSAAIAGYLATWMGWNSPFLLAAGFCICAAVAVSGIDPRRSVA